MAVDEILKIVSEYTHSEKVRFLGELSLQIALKEIPKEQRSEIEANENLMRVLRNHADREAQLIYDHGESMVKLLLEVEKYKSTS